MDNKEGDKEMKIFEVYAYNSYPIGHANRVIKLTVVCSQFELQRTVTNHLKKAEGHYWFCNCFKDDKFVTSFKVVK